MSSRCPPLSGRPECGPPRSSSPTRRNTRGSNVSYHRAALIVQGFLHAKRIHTRKQAEEPVGATGKPACAGRRHRLAASATRSTPASVTDLRLRADETNPGAPVLRRTASRRPLTLTRDSHDVGHYCAPQRGRTSNWSPKLAGLGALGAPVDRPPHGRRGEAAGTRTQDPRLKRPMLYQLSYRPADCQLL